MAKTSPEMIEKINELYYLIGVKSQVAKKLGVSPATVSKYIDPNYQMKQKSFEEIEIPEDLPLEIFQNKWEDIIKLSKEERVDLVKFKRELN